MNELPPLTTPGGKYSAYCGVCWEPVYRLWVADVAPNYEACPFGPYTAQTCPEAQGAAELAKFSAELRARGLTLAQYFAELCQPTPANPLPDTERAG